MHTLPVGFPCVFLKGGTEACPALVVRPKNGSIIDLIYFTQGMGTSFKGSVYHTSDPILISQSDRRGRDGCWDYVKQLNQPETEAPKPFVGSVDRPVAVKEDNPPPEISELDERAWKLSEEGKKAIEIAEIIGHGWTHQRVNQVLRRKRDKLAGAY